MTPQTACMVLLAALLLYVVVDDLRAYRIRNGVVLALLAVSIAAIVAGGGWRALGPHVLFGVAGFLLLLLGYTRNLLGGGDAKLLSVAFFAIGPDDALLFSLALLCLTTLYWLGAKVGALPYRRIDGRMQIPFGPSIAGGWIAVLLASAATLGA